MTIPESFNTPSNRTRKLLHAHNSKQHGGAPSAPLYVAMKQSIPDEIRCRIQLILWDSSLSLLRKVTMDQVLGRIQIEEIAPQTGLKPLLRINVTLISKYDSAFDLMTVNSKVEILFSEKGRVVPDIPTNYVGEALVEWRSRTVAPGDGSSITLRLPVDFDLLGEIEEIRQGHDVEIKLWITFNGIERQTAGTIGQRVVAGEIMDARYNSQGVSATIAKSKWMEFLNEWQYSPSQKNAAKELSKTILEAQQAKREAEEAAKAAKEAANLTAVTSLSEAYLNESKVVDLGGNLTRSCCPGWVCHVSLR